MKALEKIVREAEAEARQVTQEREALEDLLRRIEGLGYEVGYGRVAAQGRYEAMAFYAGRCVGYAWGDTALEALCALAMELGLNPLAQGVGQGYAQGG